MADRVQVCLGTMTFANPVNDETAAEMITKFGAAGHRLMDTAFMYVDTKTEQLLGRVMDADKWKNFSIATKANPFPFSGKNLTPASVRMQLETSLKNMGLECVDLFYLHAPDHKNPIKKTLEACNQLHKEGKFKTLGLSNYSAAQVKEIVDICKAQGWVAPTVYQGMYNALTRVVETELFPLLKELGIAFYAYNPLAGGILSGKHKLEDDPDSGRFGGEGQGQGKRYRARYWKEAYFKALDMVKGECDKANIPMAAAALRWIVHHSGLSGARGDAVILGASSMNHLEANLQACGDGPLPSAVHEAWAKAWDLTKDHADNYSR